MQRPGFSMGIVAACALLAATVVYGQQGTAESPTALQPSAGQSMHNPNAEPQPPADKDYRASPVGTAFTYQGQLNDGGSPADGEYDMQFTLYDDLGVLVAGPICVDNVTCVGGLFTTQIDFGAQFGGDARELEIAVRPGGSMGDCAVGGGYTTLSPRQRLTPTPYALGLRLPYAGTASVGGDVVSITNANTGSTFTGLRGIQGGPATFGFSDSAGVRGDSTAGSGAGVLGISDLYVGTIGYSSGDYTYGTFGRSDGDSGVGVYGAAYGANGIGVLGQGTDWAGYFAGRGYFGDDVGIGTTSPAAKLDVAGTTRTTGFQMPTGAAAGRVLTSDASGNGTWQSGPPTGFTSGFGNDPTATTQFLTPYVTVTITAGQKIFVSANKAFGSAAAGGAGNLDLYIGYRVNGSGATPSVWGGGILNNQVPQNTRVTMGVSAVITGLGAGTYDVGMVGDDDGNGNWNSNEYGYVSVIVLN